MCIAWTFLYHLISLPSHHPCRAQRLPCFPCQSWHLWTSIRIDLKCWSPGGRSSWTTCWSWCWWHLFWPALSSCPGTEWCAFPWTHLLLQILAITVSQLAAMCYWIHRQSNQHTFHTTSAQILILQPGVDVLIWSTSSTFTLARYCNTRLTCLCNLKWCNTADESNKIILCKVTLKWL